MQRKRKTFREPSQFPPDDLKKEGQNRKMNDKKGGSYHRSSDGDALYLLSARTHLRDRGAALPSFFRFLSF